jgi:hypothetical protein
MKSTNFQHGGATLFIDLVEEDEQKPYVRANLFLSLLDVQFTNLPIIKGILISSGNNATAPLSFEVALEKCGSFFEAYSKSIDPTKRNPLLCLEVVKKRLEINSTNIFSEEKLKSYPLFALLNELTGHYLIEYISLDGSRRGQGRLQKGICFIGLDGLVSFKFPASKELLKGYVDQQIFRGNKFIGINYFISQPNDPLDTQYRFEIHRNHDKGSIVEYLFGTYSSFFSSTVYKGSIVFLKLEGKGLKREEKYASIDEAFEDTIKEGEDSILIETDENGKLTTKLNELDQRAFDLLISGKYDYEYKVNLSSDSKKKTK